MKNISLVDSEAWLSIIKDRPAPPEIQPDDVAGMQQYAADNFEWMFSISLATSGMTADKGVADKIISNLAR